MTNTVISAFFGLLIFGEILCYAENTTDNQIVDLDQLLSHNATLVVAAKEATMRYIQNYPSETNDVARIRIDEEPENFNGSNSLPVTNMILTAFVNTQIHATSSGRNEFFVTFQTKKNGQVQSIFIGLWDGFGGSGHAMLFKLLQINDKYEIGETMDHVLLD